MKINITHPISTCHKQHSIYQSNIYITSKFGCLVKFGHMVFNVFQFIQSYGQIFSPMVFNSFGPLDLVYGPSLFDLWVQHVNMKASQLVYLPSCRYSDSEGCTCEKTFVFFHCAVVVKLLTVVVVFVIVVVVVVMFEKGTD